MQLQLLVTYRQSYEAAEQLSHQGLCSSYTPPDLALPQLRLMQVLYWPVPAYELAESLPAASDQVEEKWQGQVEGHT